MKITVATVCYNSADTIRDTIESVLSQTYKDIEYVIVDGASTDDTLAIAREYINRGIIVISEPDKGLYDAMNKAADIATGEFILYMNSGDIFVDAKTIEDVVPHLSNDIDMLYGGVIRIKPQGEIIEKYHGRNIEMKLLLQGKMMCHQSMFTKVSIMRKYRFDLKYSITADYDLVMRLVHDKCCIRYVDVIVSKVNNVEGLSSSVANMDKMRMQDDMSLKENFPLWFYVIWPAKQCIRTIKRFAEKKEIQNQ